MQSRPRPCELHLEAVSPAECPQCYFTWVIDRVQIFNRQSHPSFNPTIISSTRCSKPHARPTNLPGINYVCTPPSPSDPHFTAELNPKGSSVTTGHNIYQNTYTRTRTYTYTYTYLYRPPPGPRRPSRCRALEISVPWGFRVSPVCR